MKVLLAYLVCIFASSVGELAEECNSSVCTLENNCACTTGKSPISPFEDTPRLVSLTFSEAVTEDLYDNLWEPLLFNRKNPDGAPISGTFFVPHEYTNYYIVHDLYINGFEIGVNSITSNYSELYWATASVDTLIQEFEGQRTIISHFANIPKEDIVGVRTPQLQLQGDVSISSYVASGFEYDSSWSSDSRFDVYPYTLDYKSTQECRTGTTCPVESHPGFWIAPIVDRQGCGGMDWMDCNNLGSCNVTGTADEIADWLLHNIVTFNSFNRYPVTIIIPSDWFRNVQNSYQGFAKFLDAVATMDDVFLVNLKQVIDWARNPVPLNEFKTAGIPTETECNKNICFETTETGDVRYLPICDVANARCPDVYPWLGNPLGEKQKGD
ncbi:hypothetical protein Zmor_016776 [Zophobas morio]|uniref:Uncharacterized protein n=1 Tax=Zophobas morio TaxID=2755281 RepID=A0AA38MBY3_9CUCU|nr:hypothetical protein Zmor_016776 [Zophobas morio]